MENENEKEIPRWQRGTVPGGAFVDICNEMSSVESRNSFINDAVIGIIGAIIIFIGAIYFGS